jgi:hypothetical protein
MINSNLIGLLLVWYYSELEQLGASKNQVNKYFHTIFSPVEVSGHSFGLFGRCVK